MGGSDCRDDDPMFHPGALEIPDGRDQDCDVLIDEDTVLFDDDADGYVEVDGDCNDFRSEIHPGAPEIPGNAIDEDCGVATSSTSTATVSPSRASAAPTATTRIRPSIPVHPRCRIKSTTTARGSWTSTPRSTATMTTA